MRYESLSITKRLLGLVILLVIISSTSIAQVPINNNESTLDTSKFPNIEAAKASIDKLTSTKKVLIVSRAETLNSQLTLDANIDLVIQKGANIHKGSNGRLTIKGGVDAPASHIFIGFAPGEVILTGTPQKVIPQWWGASGNGVSDDTIALQSAASSLSNGGTIFIPDGVYIIDPTYNPEGGKFGGIKLKTNTTLTLSNKAVLQAKTVSSGQYSIVRAWNVNNVIIEGGRIRGERSTHQGKNGEWGFGIDVRGSSKIMLRNITINDCWGDGIYLGATTVERKVLASSNVTIENIVSDNNRRQGLSITQANDVKVTNSIFQNTNGASPEAGIDIEPNAFPCKNISIVNCRLINNNGSGVEGYHSRAISIDSCYFEKNTRGVYFLGGGFEPKVIAQITVKNSTLKNQKISSFQIGDYTDYRAENNHIEDLTTTVGGHVYFPGTPTDRRVSLINNTFVNNGNTDGVYNFRNNKPDSTTVFNYTGNIFTIHGKPATDTIKGSSNSIFKNNKYILESDFSSQLLDRGYILYFATTPPLSIYDSTFTNNSNNAAKIGDYNHAHPVNCNFSRNFSFPSR